MIMAGCGCGGSKTGPTSYDVKDSSGTIVSVRSTEIEAAAAAERIGGSYTPKS
jgi:hypothetical protein